MDRRLCLCLCLGLGSNRLLWGRWVSKQVGDGRRCCHSLGLDPDTDVDEEGKSSLEMGLETILEIVRWLLGCSAGVWKTWRSAG